MGDILQFKSKPVVEKEDPVKIGETLKEEKPHSPFVSSSGFCRVIWMGLKPPGVFVVMDQTRLPPPAPFDPPDPPPMAA